MSVQAVKHGIMYGMFPEEYIMDTNIYCCLQKGWPRSLLCHTSFLRRFWARNCFLLYLSNYVEYHEYFYIFEISYMSPRCLSKPYNKPFEITQVQKCESNFTVSGHRRRTHGPIDNLKHVSCSRQHSADAQKKLSSKRAV